MDKVPIRIEEFKQKTGYTLLWDFFLPDLFYQKQLMEWRKSGDTDCDHYKWGAYQYILHNTDFSDKASWLNFVKLVDEDKNEHLFKGAISALINTKRISHTWLKECSSLKILSCGQVKQYINKNK